MGSQWGKSVSDLDPPQSDEDLARRNDAQLSVFVRQIAPGTRAPDREDIAQDAWVKTFARRDSVPKDRNEERTWLRAVTRNLVRDRWRRRERDRLRDPHVAASAIRSAPGADEFVIAGLEAETVRAAFERLSPIQKRVLEWRILEGRPAAETAVLLQRRPDDVRQIQFRAIAAMRRDLARRGWFDEEGGAR